MRDRFFGAIPLFDRRPVNPSVPIGYCAAIARRAGQGRPQAGACALPLKGASTVAGLLLIAPESRAGYVIRRAFMLAVVSGMIGIAPVMPVQAQDGPAHVKAADPFAIPIAEASFRFAIPEQWIRAIIAAESNNVPSAVSPKGAIGLMQVMPGTAELMSGKLEKPYVLGDLTSNPAYNVTLGAGYLAQLVEEFGPAVALIAAGYNAGPGRPRRWITEFGDPRTESVDIVDWVETIPFAETRTYVMRVVESLVIYRAKLRGAVAVVNVSAELTGR